MVDDKGHEWDDAWVETGKAHPGFGGSTDICGYYTSQCIRCGMYSDEFQSLTDTPGKYEGQFCKERIR